MAEPHLTLSVLPDSYAICRLEPRDDIPGWALAGDLVAITRTGDELSVVCAEQQVPDGMRAETGWRALRVEGPLDFSLTGVLASIAGPLAAAGISIFAISTYNTDYVLVRGSDLERASQVLSEAGHRGLG